MIKYNKRELKFLQFGFSIGLMTGFIITCVYLFLIDIRKHISKIKKSTSVGFLEKNYCQVPYSLLPFFLSP